MVSLTKFSYGFLVSLESNALNLIGGFGTYKEGNHANCDVKTDRNEVLADFKASGGMIHRLLEFASRLIHGLFSIFPNATLDIVVTHHWSVVPYTQRPLFKASVHHQQLRMPTSCLASLRK